MTSRFVYKYCTLVPTDFQIELNNTLMYSSETFYERERSFNSIPRGYFQRIQCAYMHYFGEGRLKIFLLVGDNNYAKKQVCNYR